MNARFVAGLAVAAIPIMSLLGAASASADINKRCTAPISATDTAASTGPMPGICTVGKYNNTVGKYNDPSPSVTTVHAGPPDRRHELAVRDSVVRPADMAVRKEFPLFAAPFDSREFAAIGQSWGNSFCHDADKRISERCLDHHH